MAIQEQEFPPGHIFFNEGDDSNCAYLITEGEVEIFKKVPQGTVLLASLGTHEFFGEMGLIDDKPRSASASAKTVVKAKTVTREQIAAILNAQPPEFVLLIKALMERLREASQKLSEIVNYHSSFSVGDAGGVKDVKRVTIKPMSDVLKQQMPENGMVISSLPFRVGSIPTDEEPNPLDWNNLYIKGADPNIMSRNHFMIQKTANGLTVTDRGTKSGTIVNGEKVGGDAEDYRIDLQYGQNKVVAGGEYSQYQFNVIWE